MPPLFPLLRLSLSQLAYYKSRYLIMGLLLVSGSLILFLSLSYLVSVQASIREGLVSRLTGHLQLYNPAVKEVSFYQDPTGQIPWIQDPEALERILTGMPGLAGFTKRILVGGLLQKGDRSMGALLAGMEMNKEIALRGKISPLSLSGMIPIREGEVLLGKGVAKVLRVAPGEKIPLLVPNESGFISGRRFLVRGLFSTPGLDPVAELFVYLNLSDLQHLLGLEKEVGHFVLFAEKETRINSLTASLTHRFKALHLPVSLFTWDEIGKPFLGILSLSQIFFGLTNLLILIIIALTVVNSTLMNLFERMPELGTLLTLGTKRTQLFIFLGGEIILFGSAAAVAGLFLGWMLSTLLGQWGLPALNPAMAMAFGQERLYFKTNGWVWLLSFGVSFLFLVLSVGIPISRACRLNPAEVLKER